MTFLRGERIEEHKHGLLLVFLFMLLLSLASLSLFGIRWFSPWLATIPIFYWRIHKPSWMLLPLVFLLGLIEDGLIGTPFGLHAFGLILMHYLTAFERVYLEHRPFAVIWVCFGLDLAIVLSLMTALMWGVDMPLTLWPLGTCAVTFLLFPVVYALCAKFDRFLRQEV